MIGNQFWIQDFNFFVDKHDSTIDDKDLILYLSNL